MAASKDQQMQSLALPGKCAQHIASKTRNCQHELCDWYVHTVGVMCLGAGLTWICVPRACVPRVPSAKKVRTNTPCTPVAAI
eukprot:4384987-Pyramimonas_sp.AAC.2